MKVDKVLQALAERLCASHNADDFAFDHDSKNGQWRFWIIDKSVEIWGYSRKDLIARLRDAIRCCHA